ncbi:aspartyl protease family protein [Geomonas sp.]|uniref:aspartyl protease family protein n=1 Tax=Geomonas sp. TaxID=2651584 RepID=UPI002B47671A|nr:aspartyl protease family protein [Geomonas sp.]
MQLASQLMNEGDREHCEKVLIDALYEVSRSILPELGYPKKSEEYLDRLHMVVEVVSFIAINLIRCAGDRRGVSVLTELGEGCQDPLLKKKFSGYAQELLAKVDAASQAGPPFRMAPVAAVFSAIILLTAVLAWSLRGSLFSTKGPGGGPASSPAAQADPAPVRTLVPAPVQAATPGTAGASSGERAAGDASSPDRPSVEVKSTGAQGEQVTRIRIIDDQVLVPVILKNGGESVTAELVMDTGATRTAIHDNLAPRLRIDPRTTKPSQAEVADGRTISSRVARIDALVAGPFTLSATEVELIPYRKDDSLHDGLLGMDFLGKHRFQVDAEHELIRWY